MSHEISYAPIVVTHHAGARFAAQVRSHQIIVDQPLPRGTDSGPAPIELLGVSLGTCVAHYVAQFLAARDLPLEGLRVEVQARGQRSPARVADFDVRVVLPAGIPASYNEMLERVVASCPAHNTLAHGARISVSLESHASAAAA